MEPFFKAIETSLGINRQATTVAKGGFVVMALAIGLVQLADDDTLTFWHLLVAQVALMVFMLIITQLPLMARRMLAWVVALCFAFTAIAATVQSVTGNLFRPPLPLASCMISFSFAPSCDRTPSDTSSLPAAFLGTAFAQEPTAASARPALTGEALAAAQGKSRIFIQFAGYKRDQVVKLAATLAQSGWRIEGADRGGERVTTAAGLNEVRYFIPLDAGLAAALAKALQAEMPGKDITTLDLSASRYGKAETGQLEIWISA